MSSDRFEGYSSGDVGRTTTSPEQPGARGARTEPIDRRAADRRAGGRRSDDRRSTDQLELEAIREAFDREIDAGHAVTFERVARICRTFARHMAAREGRS